MSNRHRTNFSLVSQAEISSRLPKQIFLKSHLRLREEEFQPGLLFPAWCHKQVGQTGWKPCGIAFKFHPELKYVLGHVHCLSCECKTLFLQIFPPSFKHCAPTEIGRVIKTKFSLVSRPKFNSAWAEICPGIGPQSSMLKLGFYPGTKW